MLSSLNKTLCTPGARDSTRDWAKHAFEYMSVFCCVMGQWWPAMGTGALAVADLESQSVAQMLLEEVAITPTIVSSSRQPTNWRTTISKKLLHCCKNSRPHDRFPSLETWQRDWEPPRNLTLKTSGIWLQNFHRTGKTESWKAQLKPCAH